MMSVSSRMKMGHLLIIALTLLSTGLQTSKAAEWSYSGENGPNKWPGLCQTGKKQSPIDIVTEDAIRKDLGALKFIRYDFAFDGTLTNNGHSVEIHLEGMPMPTLTGGNLSSVYVFEQMHFHWGAEHTVDGVRYPLELHLVHYDKKYENFSAAMQHKNGLAVVGVLFELSKEDNKDLAPILETTKLVSRWVGRPTSRKLRNKLIPLLVLPKDHTTYYTYQGSLTTPQCDESVIWLVLTEKQTVSEAQINEFKEVRGPQGQLMFNYRPIQKLNGRRVYHRLENYNSGEKSSHEVTQSIGVLLSLLGLWREFF